MTRYQSTELHLITDKAAEVSLYRQTDLSALRDRGVDLMCHSMEDFMEQYVLGYKHDQAVTVIVDCHLMGDKLANIVTMANGMNKGCRIFLRNFVSLASISGIQNLLHCLPDSALPFRLFNPLKTELSNTCYSYGTSPSYLSPVLSHVMSAARGFDKAQQLDTVKSIKRKGPGHAQMTFRYGNQVDIRIIGSQDGNYCMGDGAIRKVTESVNVEALVALIERPDDDRHDRRVLADALFLYGMLKE